MPWMATRRPFGDAPARIRSPTTPERNPSPHISLPHLALLDWSSRPDGHHRRLLFAVATGTPSHEELYKSFTATSSTSSASGIAKCRTAASPSSSSSPTSMRPSTHRSAPLRRTCLRRAFGKHRCEPLFDSPSLLESPLFRPRASPCRSPACAAGLAPASRSPPRSAASHRPLAPSTGTAGRSSARPA